MLNTKEILDILPNTLKSILEHFLERNDLQEIRIRVNKPLIVYMGNKELIHTYVVTVEDLKAMLQRISNYSRYAFEHEIRQGYITLKGGHRVGICGNCVTESNEVKTIKDIASINIRISREFIGCSNPVIPYILNEKQVLNTIVISPPKCGKTTLLRDIARNLSDGMEEVCYAGQKICIIDERSEIGACHGGIPQMHLGLRTDILDNCPKSQGIMMAVRSMSPDVILCDEIGTYKDMESILLAFNSGVHIITSIHGFGIADLNKRIVFRELLENKVFQRAIILSGRKGAGTIEGIFDLDAEKIIWGH